MAATPQSKLSEVLSPNNRHIRATGQDIFGDCKPVLPVEIDPIGSCRLTNVPGVSQALRPRNDV